MNHAQNLTQLRDAIIEFALTHPHPVLDRFKDALRDWGDEYRPVTPAHLPAADHLPAWLERAEPSARDLLGLFTQHDASLLWEQSYRRQDAVVGDAMLADYGFVEILGQRGPFVSDRIRAGIGVYGPNIVYPKHRHHPEEIYILLAGSADFLIDERNGNPRHAGDLVHMPSNTWHGFATGDEPLIIYYLWQGGNLREISTFG